MIRLAELQDAKAIACIYNRYIAESTATFATDPMEEAEIRKYILSARGLYFVYEDNEKILGYCYAHPWKEKAAYRQTLETTVYIASEHTGRGLGKQLMIRLIDKCRQKKYHALIACITAENTESMILHTKLGFEKVSHFKQVGQKFGRWLDVVDYELILDRK